ncbi:jg1059 [Pararge aegeria aegeria]|uniref:Jg1059 protein n=1 Tax=Pararge aegeria aegeria TaxID=348720 RepID=A0A8S4QSP3_9NEOP|nr:jg1059 [Pararge aegeria aegeria]
MFSLLQNGRVVQYGIVAWDLECGNPSVSGVHWVSYQGYAVLLCMYEVHATALGVCERVKIPTLDRPSRRVEWNQHIRVFFRLTPILLLSYLSKYNF